MIGLGAIHEKQNSKQLSKDDEFITTVSDPAKYMQEQIAAGDTMLGEGVEEQNPGVSPQVSPMMSSTPSVGITVPMSKAPATQHEAQDVLVQPKRKIIEVGLRFRIDQLASIDTVHQTYHALCSLDMDWDATEEDIKNATEDARNYTPTKVPRIDPKNVVVKSTSYKPWANGNLNKLVEKDGKYYNLRRIEYDAVWSEPFEVKNFPFDVQDLTFVFQSRQYNKTDKRIFIPSRCFGDFFRVEKTYLSVADWELVHCDAFVQTIDWIYIMSNGARRDETGTRVVPRMYFRIQVRRLAKPILVRVVFWMFLLGILSFGTFGMHPSEIGDRLQYATAMVLAIVAFQFITSSIIPAVPYLTMIDKYNLLVLVFIILITLESIIAGWYYFGETGTIDWGSSFVVDLDQIAFWVLIIVYIIAHVWFIWKSLIAMRYEESKLFKTKHELDLMNQEAGYDVDPAGPVDVMTFSRDDFLKSKSKTY